MNKQIKKLADFIMFNVPGEPSRSEGAVDCAIRLLKRQQWSRDVSSAPRDRPIIGAVFTHDGNWIATMIVWSPDNACWVVTVDPRIRFEMSCWMEISEPPANFR